MFSFGQTGIFLLGGKTLEDQTSAMYLRSGDILMMAGDARLAYHAVPRILRYPHLESIVLQGIETSSEQSHSLKCLNKYLSYSRINVNIRQVEGPLATFDSQTTRENGCLNEKY